MSKARVVAAVVRILQLLQVRCVKVGRAVAIQIADRLDQATIVW